MTDIEYEKILQWLDSEIGHLDYICAYDGIHQSLRKIVKEHQADRQTSLPNNAATLAVPLFKNKPPSDAVSKERWVTVNAGPSGQSYLAKDIPDHIMDMIKDAKYGEGL